jgi:hypothetical protein
MDNYKATPEQWFADRYDWSKADTEAMTGDSAFRCVLELRDRVEALEAQAGNLKGSLTSSTPPPVATDEELGKAWDAAGVGGTYSDCLRTIYNLGVAHGLLQARSQELAEPAPVAGGLVERITLAIDRAPFDEGDHLWDEARAAILEVARWLGERGGNQAAILLRREAGR